MKKVMWYLLHIPLALFLLYEYFVFMWFWCGDGDFAFWGCGISFVVYIALHIFAYFKLPHKFRKAIIYSALILTPLLSVVTVYSILAPLCGITIQVA